MLTLEQIKQIKPGTRFARGLRPDAPGELNMTGSGKLLRWVAIRGHDTADWAIYCHFDDKDEDYIASSGDKVCSKDHIRRLVPCDDEMYRAYRR